MSRRGLRLTGLAGLILPVLFAVPESLPNRVGFGAAMGMTLALLVASGLFVLLGARRGARELLRNPDLLATCGVRLLAGTVLGFLIGLGPLTWLTTSTALQLFGVGFGLSISVVLYVLLEAAFAAWIVPQIWSAARGDEADMHASLRGVPANLLRGVLGLVVGVGPLLLVLLPFFVAMFRLRLGAVAIAAGLAIVWSVATFYVLLFLLDPEKSGAREALRTAWSTGRRRWASGLVRIAPFLVLAGLATYFSRYGSVTANVQMLWAGGFPKEAVWLQKWAEFRGWPNSAGHEALVTVALLAAGLALKIELLARPGSDRDPSRGGEGDAPPPPA